MNKPIVSLRLVLFFFSQEITRCFCVLQGQRQNEYSNEL